MIFFIFGFTAIAAYLFFEHGRITKDKDRDIRDAQGHINSIKDLLDKRISA